MVVQKHQHQDTYPLTADHYRWHPKPLADKGTTKWIFLPYSISEALLATRDRHVLAPKATNFVMLASTRSPWGMEFTIRSYCHLEHISSILQFQNVRKRRVPYYFSEIASSHLLTSSSIILSDMISASSPASLSELLIMGWLPLSSSLAILRILLLWSPRNSTQV